MVFTDLIIPSRKLIRTYSLDIHSEDVTERDNEIMRLTQYANS